MTILKRIVFLSVIVFIYGCNNIYKDIMNGPPPGASRPIVEIAYFPNKDSTAQEPEVFKPPVLHAGKNKIIFPKSKIEIRQLSEDNPIGIRLFVSREASAESVYDEIAPGQTYMQLFDGEKYTISGSELKRIYNYELANNRFLKVVAYEQVDSTVEVMRGYFSIERKYSLFTGFSSPILSRVSGNAAGFNLNNIAPSLGYNVLQRNISNTKFEHLSLDLLVTAISYPEGLNASYQYSMAIGGVVDFGGYIQVGSSYSFLDKKPYLVVGIKPYLFSNLFAGADKNSR